MGKVVEKWYSPTTNTDWQLKSRSLPCSLISTFVNLQQEENGSLTVVNRILWEFADFTGIWTLWSWWITLVIYVHIFQDSYQLLCWLARFCNTKTQVWKSTENLSFSYNQYQSLNELEVWQEFELQLRLIYLHVSYVCSVSKWIRLKALCTKKKDKTTQLRISKLRHCSHSAALQRSTQHPSHQHTLNDRILAKHIILCTKLLYWTVRNNATCLHQIRKNNGEVRRIPRTLYLQLARTTDLVTENERGNMRRRVVVCPLQMPR